jgi:hypothetical protein
MGCPRNALLRQRQTCRKPSEYQITFAETVALVGFWIFSGIFCYFSSGLCSVPQWGVSIKGGLTASSSKTSLPLKFQNGTKGAYNYTVITPQNYTTNSSVTPSTSPANLKTSL